MHLALLPQVRIHLRHFFKLVHGEMNSNLQFDFNNPSSNLGKKLLSLKPQPPPFLKLKKKKTDDNVENNGQVIMPGLETGTF